MKVSKQIRDTRLRTTIPFEGEEREAFWAYVRENGYKVGAYIRILIIRDLTEKKKAKPAGGSK